MWPFRLTGTFAPPPELSRPRRLAPQARFCLSHIQAHSRWGRRYPSSPPRRADSQGPELAMAAPGAALVLPGPPAPPLPLPPPPAVSPAVSDRYPSAAEMTTITTPTDLLIWAGLPGAAGDRTTAVGAVEASLSGATITDLHFVRDEEFSTLMAAVRVQAEEGPRPLTLIETSRARRAHGATAAFILAPPGPGECSRHPLFQ